MHAEDSSYCLVEHNPISLPNDKIGVISRQNSGWAVLDRNGYNLLLRGFSTPTQVPSDAYETKRKLESLWKAGLIEKSGRSCIDENVTKRHPNNILVKLTNNCNVKCTYCYDHQEGAPAANLSLANAKKTLHYVVVDGGEDKITISFHGGEPLLQFKQIKELVTYVESIRRSSQKISYSIQTNGTLFTPHVIDFLDQHSFSVGISLDGNSDELNKLRVKHNGQTPFAHFEALLSNYPDFVHRRCGIMSVVSELSIKNIPDFALWLQERGVTSLSLVLLQSMGRGVNIDINQVSIPEIINCYDTIISLIECGKLNSLYLRNLISCLGNFLYFADGEVCYRGVCMASSNFLVIAPDGSFKACDCSDSDEFKLGRPEKLQDLAGHTKRAAFKERSIRLGKEHPECRKCDIFGLCGGGCAARASTNNGDFHSIDHVECALFKHLYKKFLVDYATNNNALFDYFRAFENQ